MMQQDLDIETTNGPSDNPGDLDINSELMGAIAAMIKRARQRGLTRERIVERMNLALPELTKPLTLRQLNAWTASSKEHSEFPARYLPAFCWACGSMLALAVGPAALNHDVIDSDDARALELGHIEMQRAELNKRRRLLR